MREKEIIEEQITALMKGMLTLNTADEYRAFMEDLCTDFEMRSLAQRFEVAKMLRRKAKYQEIVQETGASTATISRVNRSLNHGKDGYEMVISRLENE